MTTYPPRATGTTLAAIPFESYRLATAYARQRAHRLGVRQRVALRLYSLTPTGPSHRRWVVTDAQEPTP